MPIGKINHDNIFNWQIISSEQALQPIYELLQNEMKQQDVLHADETGYQVIQSNKSKTYYWKFCPGNNKKRKIVL